MHDSFRAAAMAGLLAIQWQPSACEAQPAAGMFRIGYVTPTAQPAREQIFRQELQRLRYAEGRNLVIHYRSADGSFEKLPLLVAELVALKVDLIVARATQAALAARNATGTIPIVMVGVEDPAGLGLIAGLGRPGGNITGTATNAIEVVGKQFELLREMLPGLSRVSAVWNPANPAFQKRQLAEARSVAAKLRVELQLAEVATARELPHAFAAMAAQRPDAVLVLGDPLFTTHAAQMAQLALKHRLVAVSGTREFVEAGGLAAYGPSYSDSYRLAATYVDRVLKGARPADLPVEQSATFDLSVNAKTAKLLGIRIPPSLILRASDIVE